MNNTNRFIKTTFSENEQTFDGRMDSVSENEQTFDGRMDSVVMVEKKPDFSNYYNKEETDSAIARAVNEIELTPGPEGPRGEKGDPGYTPVKGVDYFDGKDGLPGADGKDGYTPQKNIDYFDGKDGEPGKDGVSCTHEWNGTVLKITSASGTSEVDLKGEPGQDGIDGKDGKDAALPTVTEADNGKVFGVVNGQWEVVNVPSGGASSWNELSDKPFYEENGVVKKLDTKFLPDGVPYNSTSYSKVLLCENTNFYYDPMNADFSQFLSASIEPVIGGKYVVTFDDGSSYECVAWIPEEEWDGYCAYLGDGRIWGYEGYDLDVPFLIAVYPMGDGQYMWGINSDKYWNMNMNCYIKLESIAEVSSYYIPEELKNELVTSKNITSALGYTPANEAHEHSASDITSGALSLARGGTGASLTRTSNAIIRYSGSSAKMSSTATANGALYATTANGTPKFGILPIAQGGTGATTADGVLTNLGLTATAADLNQLSGITDNVQTQLDNKANNTDIPTKTSELENDSNFITEHQDLSAYATKTEVNKKANDYSLELYNGTKGNPKPVKFATVDYSTCSSEAGVAVKIGMVSGHGNGSSYAFLQDAIIKVTHTGTITVDSFKYYGASAGTYDGATRQYGDIFWVHDATNKTVAFYCLMGQYARVNMIPFKRVTHSTGGTITQHTTCAVYESGTMEWGNNSEIAVKSDIPTVPTLNTEIWTFTLEDGSTVTKAVYIG